MRIISGKFRGKKLTKFNQKGIKPTTDKIRESVFNIIISYLKINGKNGENQFEGFNILDVFAGTGALGLEAISRGAKNVTFIEKSRDNLRVLYKNVDHLKVNENVKIIKRSIRKVKKIEEKFDLIFIDPPYQMNLIIKKTLKKILDFKIIKKKTLIVLEHSNKKKIPIPKDFEIIKEKYYGNSGLTLVKLK
ncbi:MAG: 16S rRNA (guanine(966)-N(2))-methyltransferase RsmD [Pelagibacteraceae bacterium]|nr:16S rRNA (guanine(966)-N(2))-methyltransferase RsmD [Pelagibacteraceae bacterium]PPR33573.1 MAG: Ribosomal RNA small subunit methyltransferase D [Alphaproteobacteria bacterium MarineAlpha6_Bin5]|tara:strand:- start:3530 stop:4102 length:573 start_codon:yes stop_codon:yes gene_type:complete